jgi:hypothetical protein
MAWGDSWLSYELGVAFGMDMRDWLENFGYRIPKEFCDWFRWGTIRAMAENPAEFSNALRAAFSPSGRPNAVLLSGGGNDSTGAALVRLLNRMGTAEDVLNAVATSDHIALLRAHYVTVLTAIGEVLNEQHEGLSVPVIVHGYDHPIPAGQGLPFKAKWLYKPFVDAGYKDPNGDIDLPVATKAMKALIDALNSMMSTLPAEFEFVRYLDLRGTVAATFQGTEIQGWHDDLHPHDPMFKIMAAKVDALIP